MSGSQPPDRAFGIWTATALVVGGMIGSGIFLMPASLAAYGWTSVIAWIGSISGALCIGWTMCRLGVAVPGETGAVAVTAAVLGPLPGVMIGWSYWISVWATNAAIAIAATSYLALLFPPLAATPLFGAATAVALIWLLTLVNIGGAALAGKLQVVTTILKLLPLLVVIVIIARVTITPVTPIMPLPPTPTLFAGLASAVALTLFPLLGFEAAGIAAERVRDPARNVALATMAGTALTGLIYIIVCSGIVLTLSGPALKASSAPFQLFVETYWSRGPALTISLFAAIAAIGALNGWVLLQGEVPLGMARAGLLPAWFAKVNSRDVPVRVLVISSVLASLLVLSNASKSLGGIFEFAALLTTCASLWLYLAICVSGLIRGIAVPTATIGLPFSLFAFWGAGIEASGLSLFLMLTAVPLYDWTRSRAPAEQSA